MMARLVIDGTMPGINQWRDAIQASRFKGRDMTEKHTERAACLAREQKLPTFERPVLLTFHWYEPNSLRDLDNVAGAGQKFVIDGLVKAGVLRGDGQKWVQGIQHFVERDALNPRLELMITDEFFQ